MTYIVKGNKKLLTKMANSDCSGKYEVTGNSDFFVACNEALQPFMV